MRVLDLFCGEGGAAAGYAAAGFEVFGVDTSPARLARYPFQHVRADAIEYVLEHGHAFDLIHASPTCTGYSRGTIGVPDRIARYPRLIGATREALALVGRPYVIENVADARPELVDPILLCGRQFGLRGVDQDGTPLVLDRHRLFESSEFLIQPAHETHDRSQQVAGAYRGGRRDKVEARLERHGGYVPHGDVLRALLRVPWMTLRGVQLCIPPIYTQYLGEQLADRLAA